MKISDYIINFIEEKWTEFIFSYSWWMITNLEDSIFLNNNLKLISVKHEQAWAFAAEWYAKSTGKTWIAMWTSWPWATNLITWIASAYFDSTPIIYITWQVNTHEITQISWVRQTGFQETDIVSITKNITKFSYQIKDIKEIKYILEKSFFLANHWRKWPILLDIPMNIQKQEIEENNLISYFDSDEYKKLVIDNWNNKVDYGNIIKLLKQSKKPIILVWWWSKFIRNKEKINEFTKLFNIPVVSSLMWLDVINSDNDNHLWMIWSYGNRCANIWLMNSDLVLVLWSRLDIRQTWSDKNKFVEHKKIIHIDIDENELWYNIKDTHLKINLDLDKFLDNLLETLNNNKVNLNFKNWKNKLLKIKNIISKKINKKEHWFNNPIIIFSELSKIINKNKVIVNDVWQNQMISANSFSLKWNDQILNSWWLGSMWFSLPASIWAYFWNNNSLIISVNWDWWFQMNIQELETIKHHNLPILIIVLNNESLWMVREFQDNYFEWRNVWTVIWYSCPNIQKIAKAYWLDYYIIKNWNYSKTLEKCSNITKPTILEIKQSPKSSINKVMYWNTLDNQSPELDIKLKEKIKNILNK
jgi:acetolactate synthase-1/2/3 large subunit